MYPIMLPGTVKDDPGITTYRNPDDLFPDRQGTPPDRIGVLYIRLLERLEDSWNAIRHRRVSGSGTVQEQSTPPGTTAPQTR